jgi:hypothetical protein
MAFAGLVLGRRETARGAARGITAVVRGTAVRGMPRTAAPGSGWRYGLGYPFQVAPGLAGLFCNIKGTRGNDFEEGSDVILFDDLAALRVGEALPVSRNHQEPNPYTAPPGQTSIMAKYPVGNGFVPLGAKRPDGSPHPAAGTGFGILGAEAWPPVGNKSHGYASGRTGGPGTYEYLEIQQYRFDGRAFRVEGTERVYYDQLLPGWTIYNPGLSTAIADGDDLLQAFASSAGADRRRHNYDGVDAGVLRWRHGPKGWRPVEFLPATGPGSKGFIEPTLIRALDGALLLLARWGSDEEQHDIRIWRSTDAARSWRKVVHVAGVVASTPISLNRAADGTPYVATNPYEILLHPVRDPEGVWARRRSKDDRGRIRGGGSLREKLALFPLVPDLNDVAPAILARDPYAEFGLPPSGYQWDLDHPVSATVQLGDGNWHNALCYRLCDLGETRLGSEPAPQSGLYVDEVVSAGPATPIWNF